MSMAIGVLLSGLAVAAGTGRRAPEASAARSVHLWYPAPTAVLFRTDLRVLESRPGSYFMACGFAGGYFGIQQMPARGERRVLFSVWDPTRGDDPGRVPETARVEEIAHDPDVTVRRFGGEGTGAQAYFSYPWRVGIRYTFAIRAERSGDRTAYTAFFRLPEQHAWKRIATLRARTGDEGLKGLYSFIEDFRRDGRSALERRRAVYCNGWVRSLSGDWIRLARARFTADSTPLNSVNAAMAAGGFLLETGGDVHTAHPLNSVLSLDPTGEPTPE